MLFNIILAFQAASRPIGTDGLYVSSVRLYINVYTAPCYLIIVLAIVSGVLLLVFFQEDFGDVKKKFQRENEKIARSIFHLLLVLHSTSKIRIQSFNSYNIFKL